MVSLAGTNRRCIPVDSDAFPETAMPADEQRRYRGEKEKQCSAVQSTNRFRPAEAWLNCIRGSRPLPSLNGDGNGNLTQPPPSPVAMPVATAG